MAYTLADDNKYNELILAARVKGNQALVSKYEQARGMRVPPSEVQSALATKTAQTPEQQSYNELMRMRDELGINWDPGSGRINMENASYNPVTGAYEVKNEKGFGQQNAAFNYDPTKNRSSIYGTQLAGALDPRIALGMADADYAAADKWQKDIWDKIDATINQGVSSGAIVPSYSVEQKGSGMSLNDWAGPMNATPTDTYLKNQASRYRFNDSSIDQYIQKANPELFKQYKILSNSNDTTGASMYMEQAYKNAQGRLGSQYQDDFYGSLKTQYKDMQGMLMTPEQKAISDRQAIMDNPSLNPAVKEAILKGMEPKDPWNDLMTKYGPKTTPPAPTSTLKDAYSGMALPQFELDAQKAKAKTIEDQKKGIIDPATVAFFEGNNPGKTVEMVNGEMALVPKKSPIPTPTVDSAKPAQTAVPAAVTPATMSQATTPTANDYAKELVSKETTPVPASTLAPSPTPAAALTSSPWSKEFETKTLDIMGGFKSSLDDYLKILSTPAVPAQAKASFSLNSNTFGATGQRNSGLVSTTPQPFGSTQNQTASPFTGKAGATGSTTANAQSLWR